MLSSILGALRDFLGQPFVKKFLVDAIESGLAVIVALNVAFPQSLDEAKATALVIGVAFFAAVVSAARRAAPDFWTYLKSKLGL